MKTILPSQWTLPKALTTRLGDSAGRQRALFVDGHLLVVLHEPPKEDDLERKARFFWRNPSGEWQSNSLGQGPQSLKRHVAEFLERSQAIDDRLDRAQTAEDYFGVLQATARFHRTTRNLLNALSQAHDLLPDDRDLLIARDSAADVERAAEMLQADAKAGLDFTVARQAELQSEQARYMAVAQHRLNLLAAIFFPLATLAAVLGMNIEHGLERYPGPGPFLAVLAAGLLAGLLLMIAIAARPERPPAPQRRDPHGPPPPSRSAR